MNRAFTRSCSRTLPIGCGRWLSLLLIAAAALLPVPESAWGEAGAGGYILPPWAAVACPYTKRLVVGGDLERAAVVAARESPDCLVLVAETYRTEGQREKAKDVMRDGIKYAEYPERESYPLVLFYKVAYLDGNSADLAKLQARDPAWASAAVTELMQGRRDEFSSYLRAPFGAPCPRVDGALSGDALFKRMAAICDLSNQLSGLSGSGRGSLPQATEVLRKLKILYPVYAFGDRFDVPVTIADALDEAQKDTECLRRYDKAWTSYETLLGKGGPLLKQRDGLQDAWRALEGCPGITQRRTLSAQNRQLEDRLREINDELEQQRKLAGIPGAGGRGGGAGDDCAGFKRLTKSVEQLARSDVPVRETLAQWLKVPPEHYIQPETLAHLNHAPMTASWLWVAFADCRLAQERYSDALENLERAAAAAGSGDRGLRQLIVARAVALGQRVDPVGNARYGSNWLAVNIGQPGGSEWLRAELMNASGSDTGMGGGAAYRDASTESDHSSQVIARGNVLCGQPSGSIKNRYRDYWIQLYQLPYYARLAAVSGPGLKSVFEDAERTRPEVFAGFAHMDRAKNYVADPRLRKLADRLQDANVTNLKEVAAFLPNDSVYVDLVSTCGDAAELLFRHMVARKAIELRCYKLALQQVRAIPVASFSSTAPDGQRQLAAAVQAFHEMVIGALEKLAPTNPTEDDCGGR